LDDVPLATQLGALAVLLILSGFFSLAEISMMAANRYRLKALVRSGHRGARLAEDLLAKTDQLLGVILLFNNLINAAAAVLMGLITIQLFGEDKSMLGIGTLVVTFLILVFAEITPKVVGASYADRIVPYLGFILVPLLWLFWPLVWLTNLFVSGLLTLLRLKPAAGTAIPAISPQELRALVLEAGHFFPQKHRSILMNLFDLENITMEDVMTPRGSIEAIDLQAPLAEIKTQLATCYHTRLPVYEADLNNLLGILHLRRIAGAIVAGELDKEELRAALVQPYFIPEATSIYDQLQHFQETRQRIALVVDEYGEIVGLATLEDIIEEIVGKFTTTIPGGAQMLTWDAEGTVMAEGGRNLRELNRLLDLGLPLTGPKTLNGLILEHFQDIPEAGVSVKIAGVPMEILQTQDRRIKMVRLTRPVQLSGEPGFTGDADQI